MQVGYSLQPEVNGCVLADRHFLMFQIQSRHLPYFIKVLLCYSIPPEVICVQHWEGPRYETDTRVYRGGGPLLGGSDKL